MKKQKNIQYFTAKAVSFGLLVLFNLFPAEQANAENLIICGGGTNRKCDLDTRQCVKYKETKFIVGCQWPAECSYEVDVYKCIGKKEPKPKGATNVTVSTNAEGKVLAGKDEQTALNQSKESDHTAFEIQENVNAYYAKEENKALTVSDSAQTILDLAKKNEDNDEVVLGVRLGKANAANLKRDMEELARYTGKDGWTEGLEDSGWFHQGSSMIQNRLKGAYDNLKSLKKDNYITQAEYDALKAEIDKLSNIAKKRLKEANEGNGTGEEAAKVEEKLADVQETIDKSFVLSCPTSDQLIARYHAGCWSCLVLEKLTSAFLHAANHGLKVVQRAGLTLLWLGTAIWIVFWGLKNVSSFTQVDLGNILNDLIKFLFKVAIAYWFIIYSPTAISKYFITPMMSIGALIGQEFWSQDVKEFTENYDEAFEPDNPEEAEKVEKEVEENNKKGMGGANTEAVAPSNEEEDTTGGTGVVEQPKPVQYDSTEAVVQDLQKAFINILRKQLSEIKNSCGGPCGEGCRHKSCSNAGHRSYIKSIMQLAGYGATVDHYCQASITAAMAKLAQAVGAKESVLKKAGASCFGGIGLGAVGDIKLCDKGRQVYQNINVGDTVYYHNVIRKGGSGKKVGGGSGHHAVTYSGSGKTISFNGDSEGSMCNSYYYDVWGKVLCVSCLLREKIKKDPNFVKNTGALSSLAKGINMTLVNYEGGSFSSVGMADAYTGGAGDTNYDSLIVEIPEVKYTGPTNIMPKSIMNSILGATRAITSTTANVMVLGDMIMCYSQEENGGAWRINAEWLPEKLQYWTNWVMWIQGGIIWCLGFMLTVAIAYYLIDISFKIGFAVLAIPVMMGLWPFGFTQGKIFVAISIIAKSSATFAFLALTTAFGMGLVSSSINGVDALYETMDAVSQGEDVDEIRKNDIRETLYLFSPTFVLLVFSILYFYKLVQQTISDLVNKFFPDQAFGDSSPMHSGATMATSYLKKMGMSVTGANLAKDIVANQAGNLVKGGLKKAGSAIRHPINSAKKIGQGVKNAAKAVTGKKSSGGK